MPVNTTPKSQGVSPSAMVGWDRDYPPKPTVDWQAIRLSSENLPLPFWAHRMIVDDIRSATWRVNLAAEKSIIVDGEEEKPIEDWLNNALDPIYDFVVMNALNGVAYGFQCAEIYFYRGDDGRWWPRKPEFPYPETYDIRQVYGEYAGYRQDRALWGMDEKIIPASTSIHWCYGGMIHNNPYGLGTLRAVSDFVKDYRAARSYALETSYRHAEPIMVLGIPGEGYAGASVSQMVDDVKNNLILNRVLAYAQYDGNEVKAFAFPPNASAVQDIQSLVDYLDRQIALGMLVALRTMYSGQGDGGSYSLVEIQRNAADQIISGIMEMLRPGLERLCEIILTVNGYPELIVDLDFDLEKPGELTSRAAMSLLNELIRGGVGLDRVDLKRLEEQAGITLFTPDGTPAETPLVREAPVDSTPNDIGTENLAAGRVRSIPPKAAEARRLLDASFEKIFSEYSTRFAGDIKESTIATAVDRAINAARDVYAKTVGPDIPELSEVKRKDWAEYPARLWQRRVAALDSIAEEVAAATLRGQDTEELDKVQRGNLARKLADKVAHGMVLYFTDLQAARVNA